MLHLCVSVCTYTASESSESVPQMRQPVCVSVFIECLFYNVFFAFFFFLFGREGGKDVPLFELCGSVICVLVVICEYLPLHIFAQCDFVMFLSEMLPLPDKHSFALSCA